MPENLSDWFTTDADKNLTGDSPYSLYYKFTTSENEEFADRFIKLE